MRRGAVVSKVMLNHRRDMKKLLSLRKKAVAQKLANAARANEEGEDLSVPLIDLKATAHVTIAARKTAKGWQDLFSFLAFFGLFCAVLVLQVHPEEIFNLDEALRLRIVDEGGKMQEPTLLGDFFDYLNNQIMPSVFPSDWYNDEALTTTESAYLLGYNKLVGGLLIVQTRGAALTPCRKPYFTGFQSSYKDFYPVCYSSNSIADDIPKKLRVASNVSKFPNAVPWRPGVAAPPPDVNATRSDPSLGNFWQSFSYDDSYEGFASFLALADGSALNLQKVAALQKYKWLDEYTRRVQIKFAVYNGFYKYFLFVSVTFNYDQSGVWVPYSGGDGAMACQIKGVRMEPYRIGPQYRRAAGTPLEPDAALLVLEVVFLVWLFFQISELLRTLADTYVREGWNGREEVDAGTGALAHVGGLRGKLLDPFIVLDVANYALFILYVYIRVTYVTLLLTPANIISVPTNRYEPILERAAELVEQQLLYNFFNIVLMLARCFKFYRFQPRLALINKTFSCAFEDLYHFLLMFITILVAFSVMAHALFGAQMGEFGSFGRSINTCFLYLLMSAIPYYPALSYVNGVMGSIWFMVFNFFVVIVLLNTLLAIIVDAYSDAMSQMKEPYHGDDTQIPAIWSNLGTAFRHATRRGPVTDDVLLAGLALLRKEGVALATEEELWAAVAEAYAGAADIAYEDVVDHYAITYKEPDHGDGAAAAGVPAAEETESDLTLPIPRPLTPTKDSDGVLPPPVEDEDEASEPVPPPEPEPVRAAPPPAAPPRSAGLAPPGWMIAKPSAPPSR